MQLLLILLLVQLIQTVLLVKNMQQDKLSWQLQQQVLVLLVIF